MLPLEDYRDRLTTEWLQAEWPTRVRSVLQQYRDAPLPDVPLAYPTNWGIECDGPLAGMRVDFPTELGLSYLYGPARALRPEAATLAERVDAWSEVDGVWHFNGMDNTFYFTVLYPAILAAAGLPTARAAGAVVNELYLLEGQKFSTSRNHALWAHEFLAAEDPELVRLYLSLGPAGPVRERLHARRRTARSRPTCVRCWMVLAATMSVKRLPRTMARCRR